MKKVISYSVFGDNPRYSVNAVLNAEQAVEFYPGWEVRIYHDSSLPRKVIAKLWSYEHVKMFDMSHKYNVPYLYLNHSPSTFWRFYAYDDKDVDIMICRDSDSYLSKREADAVDQWLETGRPLHIMRETQPGHRSKIMAGMFGLRKNDKLKSVLRLFDDNVHLNYQNDQGYLNNLVYPLYGPDERVVHDDDNAFSDRTHDWPTPRAQGDMFVGRTQGPPCQESGMVERYEQLLRELK